MNEYYYSQWKDDELNIVVRFVKPDFVIYDKYDECCCGLSYNSIDEANAPIYIFGVNDDKNTVVECKKWCKDNEIMIYENDALTLLLCKLGDLGKEIPRAFYVAVARQYTIKI